MVKYSDLAAIAAISTSSSHVKLIEDPVKTALLIRLSVNKVYEVFKLRKAEFKLTSATATTVIHDALPDDLIRVLYFFVEGKSEALDYNCADCPVRYTGNTTIEVDHSLIIGNKPIVVTYVGEYLKHNVPDSKVFTEQYLECFMTYFNYLIHRMVGFTDSEVLDGYRKDYERAVQDVKDNGLSATTYHERSTKEFNDSGFK